MAYNFPKVGTNAAGHITPHVHECLAQPHRVPTLAEARGHARNFFKTTTSGATGHYSMCLLADDSLALVFFGIRGAERVTWNFGKA